MADRHDREDPHDTHGGHVAPAELFRDQPPGEASRAVDGDRAPLLGFVGDGRMLFATSA
jgi:hypothetical protein